MLNYYFLSLQKSSFPGFALTHPTIHQYLSNGQPMFVTIIERKETLKWKKITGLLAASQLP